MTLFGFPSKISFFMIKKVIANQILQLSSRSERRGITETSQSNAATQSYFAFGFLIYTDCLFTWVYADIKNVN